MKVGKLNEFGEMLLVECEQGMEVGGSRTTEELYVDGYKDVCEIERPSEDAVMTWQEYEGCFVQVWEENMEDMDGDGIS